MENFAIDAKRCMVGKELRNSKRYVGPPSRTVVAFRSLDASDINQLQRIYPEIVDELKDSFSQLREGHTTWRMAKVQERRILKVLASLQPLVNVKSSIFLLRGLKPSIFALFYEILPLTDFWLIQNSPDCHFALLKLAIAYAKTHDQFMSSSDIGGGCSTLGTNATSTGPHMSSSSEQITSKYFAQVLAAVTQLLRHFQLLGIQAQNVMLDWLQQLTGMIADQMRTMKKIREIFALRAVMLDLLFTLHQSKLADQRKQFVKCMYRLQAFDLLQSEEPRGRQIAHRFVGRLIHCAGKLNADQFRMVWTRTPITFLIRLFGLLPNGHEYFGASKSDNSSPALDYCTSAQQQLGQMSLESYEFQIISDFILDGKPISLLQDGATLPNWIQWAAEMFYDNFCQNNHQQGKVTNNQRAREEKENGEELLGQKILLRWQVVVGQLALFCIVNRMRTPIGRNPLETFTRFENELRSLSAQTMQRKPSKQPSMRNNSNTTAPFAVSSPRQFSSADEPRDQQMISGLPGEEEIEAPTNSEGGQLNRRMPEQPQLCSEEEWFRVRLLLHCIDQMDKLMGFAKHGSMLEIAMELPLNSRHFFFINQTSCTDWLCRTAIPLMGVAFSNGHFAQIVRLAGFLFTETERKNSTNSNPIYLESSTFFAICWLIRALVELGAPQAIRGVHRWVERTFKLQELPLEWCNYAELLAAARVEEALDGFLSIQQQQRLAFAQSQSQSTSEENDGAKEEKGSGHSAKLRDYMLKVVEELAFRAASVLRDPQNGQKLYDAFVQKRIAITKSATEEANETQKQFKRFQWKRVIALSQWDQLADMNYNEPSVARQKFLPWEMHGRLLDTEADILRLFELRQQRKEFAIHGRSNTSEALYDMQDELSNTAQLLLLGGTEHSDGLNHAKIAFLHALCTGVQHLQQQKGGGGGGGHFVPTKQFQQHQQRSPIKQGGSGGLPILLEFDYGELLYEWKSETLHRLELGQTYCGWMQRLYGGQKEHSHAIRKMHRDMAQLAQESGNPQLASLHLRLAGISNDLVSIHSQQQTVGNECFGFPRFDGIDFSDSEQQLADPFQCQPPPGFFSPSATATGIDGLPMTSPPGFIASPKLQNFSIPTNPSIGNTVATQILLSEEFDGDTVKLLPAEMTTALQFGINICSDHGRQLETLIGEWPTYEEFCQAAVHKFPISDIMAASLLGSLGQPAFQEFWLQIKHRQYRLYELAMNSHLRFLENLFAGKSHVQTVEVILRLLKMLGRQPEWFVRIVTIAGGGEMNTWMERIAIDVWIGVVPQLFAYLNHEKTIVRNVVSLLLDRIGHHLPHVICYTAIVIADEQTIPGNNKGFSDDVLTSIGITSKQQRAEADEENIEPINTNNEVNLETNDCTTPNGQEREKAPLSHLVDCCRLLVNSLSGSHPQLVSDTRLFCRALQRIALLHEEQWLYVLGQFDQQVNRLSRTAQMADATKMGKVRSCFDKILASLRTLYANTCGAELESENERQFSAAFDPQIHTALVTLEQQNLVGNPFKGWEPFKQILATLNKQAMKRASLCLNVSKMSTHLAELGSACTVPMPGQEHLPYSEVVSVHKMAKVAQVLPTKTRPKKIAFIGSDGKTYTFLFKGQENLHMDARLMQLLRLCNSIFKDPKNQHQMDVRPAYSCVTYSVTPLGKRSGLIQWVDGSVPLFQIYRKWLVRQAKFLAELEESKQQKMAAASSLLKQPGNGQGNKSGLINLGAATITGGGRKMTADGSNNRKQQQSKMTAQKDAAEPERPVEQFYNRLKTIFAANAIPREQLADRQRWPRKLVKQVLGELVNETPKDILAKEIWMHAGTSAAWWSMTQRFARTAAVGSMLGSLIGLGDRHLDNVLVNLSNGQIVHVDYNICFGKGRTLRVPETVPFRLTGNIAQAMGPTNIDGTFRLSSECVLEMLRADKLVLLQLLETLKFDSVLDFSFLQGTVDDATENSPRQIAAQVVHQLHRKLDGHELVRKQRGDKMASWNFMPKTPGMFKLPGMEAMDGEGDGERKAGVPKTELAAETVPNMVVAGQSGECTETGQMSVPEQVDFLIREATDLENLALMYEGWTAWV